MKFDKHYLNHELIITSNSSSELDYICNNCNIQLYMTVYFGDKFLNTKESIIEAVEYNLTCEEQQIKNIIE